MKLYVGNLAYSTTEDTLHAEFGVFGKVDDVAIITDRQTGRPRGFAFVTMADDGEGSTAIEKLNGVDIDGRSIVVNEAKPKTDRGGRGGGGGGGGRRW